MLSNGLNPIWNRLMQFSICVPELCLIRFTVKDSDKSGTDLGQYSIPFLSMQHGSNTFFSSNQPTNSSFSGYRHIRLLNGHNDPTTATLFINVKVTNTEGP